MQYNKSATSSSTTTLQTLRLREHQCDHFNRILGILSKFYFYVDGSEMGTGKTYVAASVAISLKLPVLVICPLAARKIWEDVFTTYGVVVYNLPDTGGIITYETLCSKKGYKPKHGMLLRDDSGVSTEFYPTNIFVQMVQAGVLVIFDECQRLKNQGNQNKAGKALIRQIYALGGKSRIALLSGSAFDKEIQLINFLKMVGLITSRNLYLKVNGEIHLEGIQELYNWARRIDATATNTFISNNEKPTNQKQAVKHVFNIFNLVIKPGIMTVMPRANYYGEKDVKNGYYLLSNKDDTAYQMGISNLAETVSFNPKTYTIIQNRDNIGAVITALIQIQKAKMRCMVRLAHEELIKEPVNKNNEKLYPKIILYADYYEVIDFLLEELKQYNPVELTGRLSESIRNVNISKFQKPNNDCRLFIGNPLSGGIGVSLHDTDGHFPRIMYIMPGYRINELHQATGRIFRDGTLGNAKIRFLYGISLSMITENSILTSLSRKGETMQKVHSEQSNYGMIFPNEYEDEYEVKPSTL